MFKYGFSLLLAILVHSSVFANSDTSAHNGNRNLRVSFLYCGVGNATWQTFGHCAIRIVDSTKDSLHRDLTYNYGIYDPYEGTLQEQFLRGRIRVALETTTIVKFLKVYEEEGRCVEEFVLELSDAQKERMQAYLDSNALTENKYYTYHFFYDNCTIRVRNVFPETLGSGFVFGETLPRDAHITFNDGYNLYFQHKYWYKMLANIFFGSETDIPMNGYQAMFLPDFLRTGIKGATMNGRKICSERHLILESRTEPLPGINVPFIITTILAILTLAGLLLRPLHMIGKLTTHFILFLTSLIGIAILYAWFCTEYDLSRNNYNIFWALPTNVFLPFLPRKIKNAYVIVGMLCICACLVLHIMGVQVMLLTELVPLWFALFCIYGAIYRQERMYVAR